MRKLILDVTPDRHNQRARKIHGSLIRASGLISIIVISSIALWIAHAVGLVPLIDRKLEIPEGTRKAVGKVETPGPGGTGFMVDPTRFLTTLAALTDGTSDVKEGTPVEISFPTANGTAEPPVKGVVHWKSVELDGAKLVIVKLASPRTDFIDLSSTEISDAKRIAVLGFFENSGDLQSSGKSFSIVTAGDTTLLQWGDRQPPAYEGFAVLNGQDFGLLGILTEGRKVIKVSAEDLKKAGVNL